jgi:hypothetical protein
MAWIRTNPEIGAQAPGCKASSRDQPSGAREIDERRRTHGVRWSEAVERNETDGPFSAVC